MKNLETAAEAEQLLIGVGAQEHIHPTLQGLPWIPKAFWTHVKALILTHMALNGLGLIKLQVCFLPYVPLRPLRSAKNKRLQVASDRQVCLTQTYGNSPSAAVLLSSESPSSLKLTTASAWPSFPSAGRPSYGGMHLANTTRWEYCLAGLCFLLFLEMTCSPSLSLFWARHLNQGDKVQRSAPPPPKALCAAQNVSLILLPRQYATANCLWGRAPLCTGGCWPGARAAHLAWAQVQSPHGTQPHSLRQGPTSGHLDEVTSGRLLGRVAIVQDVPVSCLLLVRNPTPLHPLIFS